MTETIAFTESFQVFATVIEVLLNNLRFLLYNSRDSSTLVSNISLLPFSLAAVGKLLSTILASALSGEAEVPEAPLPSPRLEFCPIEEFLAQVEEVLTFSQIGGFWFA